MWREKDVGVPETAATTIAAYVCRLQYEARKAPVIPGSHSARGPADSASGAAKQTMLTALACMPTLYSSPLSLRSEIE